MANYYSEGEGNSNIKNAFKNPASIYDDAFCENS